MKYMCRTCKKCGGKGRVDLVWDGLSAKCLECNGTGNVNEKKN